MAFCIVSPYLLNHTKQQINLFNLFDATEKKFCFTLQNASILSESLLREHKQTLLKASQKLWEGTGIRKIIITGLPSNMQKEKMVIL